MIIKQETTKQTLNNTTFNPQMKESISTMQKFRSYIKLGIIDFYILRQFLRVLFAILFLISMFYILMDYLNSSDLFSQMCKEHNVALIPVMFEFYTPRLLGLYDSLLSTFILFSGLITVIIMSGKKETIALACMGIPRARAIYMIIVFSVFLTFLGALNREYILPSHRSVINGDIKSFFSQSNKHVESKTDPLTQIHISGETLDLQNRTIIKPVFDMPQALDKYGMELRAEVAIWQPSQLGDGITLERPAGFLLKKVSATTSLDKQNSLYIGEKPILLTPLNHPWIQNNDCFLASGIDIEDLTINSELKTYCTIPELQRIMKRMPQSQRMKAALVIHSRLARPFLDICIILIGLTFILKQENNATIIIIKAIIWSLFCWLLVNMCLAVGGDIDFYLAPTLAAWIPFIVLASILTYIWGDRFC